MEKLLEANFTQISPTPESGVIDDLHETVDEGHIHQKVHSYYVKFWANEDPNVKSKIEEAVNLIEKMNQDHFLIIEKIEEKMKDRDHVISRLKQLSHSISGSVDWKKERLDPLLLALDKLSFANNAYQDREVNSNSLAELNNYNLHYRMLHRSNSLAAEKKLLREIKASQRKGVVGSCSSLEEFQDSIYRLRFDWRPFSKTSAVKDEAALKEINLLKCAREDAIANAPVKGKVWNSLGSKETIREQIKLIDKESEESRMGRLAVRAEIKRSKKGLETIERDLRTLHKHLTDVHKRNDQAYEYILKLRKQHEETCGTNYKI